MSDIEKFVIILVCQTITGSSNPDNIIRNNSKYWTKWSTFVDFGLPIFDEMGYFGENINFNKIPSEATLIGCLKPDMWTVPQYAVFYYQDRVELYRCEPE